MDAKRLDLEAIKQDWQESRWSFASRGGWAENYAHALFDALEAAWVENERLRAALEAIQEEITSAHNQEAYSMFLIAQAALTQEPDC